jgi:hypothetical protein
MYRSLNAAPQSMLPPERRGAVVGRFCHGCKSVYPLHAGGHRGRPAFGRDHIASPCPYEGRRFVADADWWEPAVEALPAPPPAPAPPPPATPTQPAKPAA